MGFDPIVSFCRPVENGGWTTAVDNEFGAYTPCATDSLVTGISHLVILGAYVYMIWVIKKNLKVQRFKLRSNIYNYWLGLLAFYYAAEPLFRLVMGISVYNVDGETGLAPYEIVTLLIKALAWCCMLIMIGRETIVYVYEVPWFVRFGVIYALLGDAVLFNLVLSVSKYYTSSVPYKWLFPKCAAAIHHGGSGSTAAALHAGIPQVICPFMLDQFYWAERMFWLGVSPEPLKRNQLLPDEDDETTIKEAASALTTAINYALSSQIKANALQISQRLSSEDGVQEAVRMLKASIASQLSK